MQNCNHSIIRTDILALHAAVHRKRTMFPVATSVNSAGGGDARRYVVAMSLYKFVEERGILKSVST